MEYKYSWRAHSIDEDLWWRKVALLVFSKPVAERFPGRSEFAELVTDHLFSHGKGDVVFAVVDHKLEPVDREKEGKR